MRLWIILIALPFLCAQTPQQSYKQALEFYKNGNYTQALKFFREAAKARQYEEKAWRYQAQCHYCLSEYQSALEIYGRLLERRPKDIEGLYGRARVYYALNQTEKALEDISLALAIYPDNVFLHYLKGLCHEQNRNFKAALAEHQAVLALRPSFSEAHRHIGECRFETGEFNEALKSLEEAIKYGADIEHISYTKGRVYVALSEKYPDALAFAIENFKRTVAVNPKHGEAWKELGHLYFKQKNYEEAIRAYDCAIPLIPENMPCYHSRGIASYEIGHYEEARRDFEKVLARDEQNPQLNFYLGCILSAQGKDDEALVAFTRAMDYQYNYWEAYFRCAEIYMKQGKYGRAFECYDSLRTMGYDGEMYKVDFGRAEAKRHLGKSMDLEKALMYYQDCVLANPYYAPAYAGIAQIKIKQGRYQEALENINRALAIEAKNVAYYTQRGLIHQSLGDHNRAVEDFSRAMELEPQNHLHDYNRGLSYYALSDLHNAIGDFTTAIEKKPDSAEAYYMRGRSYHRLSPKRALKDYQKAIDLDPANAEYYNYRGLLYDDTKFWDEAVADFNAAIFRKEDPQFYYNRANVLFKMKEYRRALDDCTRAIAMEKKKENLELRAKIYDALGKHDLAEDDRLEAKGYK